MAECEECGSKLKNSSHLTLSLHWLDCPVILKKVKEFQDALKAEEESMKNREEVLKNNEEGVPLKVEVVDKIEKTSSYIHSNISKFLFEE